MSTFNGGQDRPHKKINIPLPKLEKEHLDLLLQLKEMHFLFGALGAKKFIKATEEMNGLPPGSLRHLLYFVGVKP